MEEAFQAVGIDFDFNKTVFSNQKILFDYSFIPYPEKYSLLETLRLLPSESPINLKNFIEETDVTEEWDDRINSFISRIKERRRDLLISEINNEKMLHFQRVILSNFFRNFMSNSCVVELIKLQRSDLVTWFEKFGKNETNNVIMKSTFYEMCFYQEAKFGDSMGIANWSEWVEKLYNSFLKIDVSALNQGDGIYREDLNKGVEKIFLDENKIGLLLKFRKESIEMCQGYTEKFMNSPYSFKGDFYTADKILGILFRYYFSSRIFDKANEILEFLEKFLNEENLKTF